MISKINKSPRAKKVLKRDIKEYKSDLTFFTVERNECLKEIDKLLKTISKTKDGHNKFLEAKDKLDKKKKEILIYNKKIKETREFLKKLEKQKDLFPDSRAEKTFKSITSSFRKISSSRPTSKARRRY